MLKLASFHRYVKPTFNPGLSSFCTELTGITQEMIKEGKSIEQTLAEFDQWLHSSPMVREDNFVFITCGEWDLGTCLRLESKHKGIPLKPYFKRYINIKRCFFKLAKVRERHLEA
jgi:inhibitor of KinA sporulation pathway (predicted exonuclease)